MHSPLHVDHSRSCFLTLLCLPCFGSYYELEAEEYARKGVTLTPELWLVKLMVCTLFQATTNCGLMPDCCWLIGLGKRSI